MIDINFVRNETIKIARDIGGFIRSELASFDRKNIELKGLNDLVSYVDKTSEKRLVEALRKLIPEAGFLAEEGTSIEQGNAYKWVIDPLDGTTNFLHGLPVFAISIALYRDDAPILGVVYEINHDEMFVAIENEPAECNGEIISVSEANRLEDSLLATGFPYHDFDKNDEYLKILGKFMKRTHGIRRMGSAAVDLVYVACGRFEGFFEFNLKPWDVAAGIFIVQQAGGIVTDFSGGNNIHGGESVIAACAVHPQMLMEIKKFWDE